MATNTTNYGWTKPDYKDGADIAVLNETFDAIDAQVKTNENNILLKQDILLYSNRSNTTTYIFNELNNIPDNAHFKYGILIGGGGANTPNKVMLWHVFVNTSEAVFFTKIIGDDTMTLTGSISDGVLTITSSATIYGGLRFIWLG